MQLTDYHRFIESKQRRHIAAGFNVADTDINPMLFDWQKLIVKWALKMGRAALFEECGMGKTLQQVEWAKHVTFHTDRKSTRLNSSH